MSRSYRSGADGVVAHTEMFRRERPPRPSLSNEPLIRSGTPPREEGSKARLTTNLFTSDGTGLGSEANEHGLRNKFDTKPVTHARSNLISETHNVFGFGAAFINH